MDHVARGKAAPSALRVVLLYSFSPGYRTVVLFRIASLLRRARLPFRVGRLIGLAILVRLSRVPGVEIRTQYEIGEGLAIPHPHDIVIGVGARIGKNVTIYNGVTLGARDDKDAMGEPTPKDARYPTIEDDVTIYPGAKIVGSIRIGRGSVIGTNAVVLKSFEAGSTIAGVPARQISKKTSVSPTGETGAH